MAAVKDPRREAPGGTLACASDRVIFGAVVAVLVTVPLVFSWLTPSSGDIKRLLLAILVAAGLLAWLVRCVARPARAADAAGRRELAWPRAGSNLPLLVFLAVSLLWLAFSPFPHASVTELWRVLVMAGLYFLGLQAARDKGRLKWFATVIAATAGLVAVYGIMQRLGLDPGAWSASPVRGRSFSTLGHPNFLAAYLAMTLPVTVVLFLAARSRKAQVLWGIDLALQTLAIYFTFSRGGWLGALGAAAALVFLLGWPTRFRGLMRRGALRGWALAGIVVVTVTLGSIIGSEYSPFTSKAAGLSIQTRVEIYKGGLRMFGARPVRGWGIGTFSTVFPRFRPREFRRIDPRPNVRHAHCEYLMLADEMGLVGLGIFAWLLLAVARSGFAAVMEKKPGPERFMLVGIPRS